ncbi:hypothetical protein HT136_04445 [Novosphingobium profundi]|uniref:SCO family protein n=1 Tax=Novosphingobium profundi TaxID=1774954 RepID=UPI001BDB2A76|nr:hypothetical protein [Novosphingobium profundi]MBT0667614.1 hypothetical protein [Novosphingobium profundi]
MKWLLVLFVLAGLASPALAGLSPAQIGAAGIRPPADARIPVHTTWIDQNEHRVRLGDLVAGKPTVLLFADYTCKHICGPGMTLTGGALSDVALSDGKLVPGRDVAFVVLGLDPKDGPEQARETASRVLADMPVVARAAHLLSADPGTVERAEKALGFSAVYDPATDQYAHDASVYVFNAKGHLSSLLPETALVAPILEKALESAGGTQAQQGFIAHIATVCYGFAAAHGVYGRTILVALQVGGMLMIVGFGTFFARMARRRRDDA